LEFTMRRLLPLPTLVIGLIMSLTSLTMAQDWENEWQVGDMHVSQAWARSAGATVAVYVLVHNHGDTAGALTGVATVDDGLARLHSTAQDGGVMRMRPVDAIPIAGEGVLAMAPGGIHIMVTGLSAPPAVGETLRLRLQFDVGSAITVQVPVLAPDATGTSGSHSHN